MLASNFNFLASNDSKSSPIDYLNLWMTEEVLFTVPVIESHWAAIFNGCFSFEMSSENYNFLIKRRPATPINPQRWILYPVGTQQCIKFAFLLSSSKEELPDINSGWLILGGEILISSHHSFHFSLGGQKLKYCFQLLGWLPLHLQFHWTTLHLQVSGSCHGWGEPISFACDIPVGAH